MRVREALVDAERQLTAAGVPSPRHDAEVLMSQTLGLSRGRIDLKAEIEPDDARTFVALIAKRCKRIPLQHITGLAPFRHLTLQVGEGVFIPRPETELVAEAAIREVRSLDRPASVLDLGAGSGAISLAIATECARAQVVAVEASPDAKGWLDRNIEAQREELDKVDSAIEVVATDFCQPLDAWLPGRSGGFDVVVSNPPYVPTRANIRDVEVADFDPPIALFGGSDGLDLVKAVIAIGAQALRPGGLLIIEHGDEQGQRAEENGVPHWVTQQGSFLDVHDRPDLNSRPRFTTAIRK